MAGGTAFQAPSSPFRGLKGRSAALWREQPFFAASFSHAVQSVPTCSPPEQKWQAGTPGAFPKGRLGKRRGHGRQVMAEAHFLLLSAVPHRGDGGGLRKAPTPPPHPPSTPCPGAGMLQSQGVTESLVCAMQDPSLPPPRISEGKGRQGA